MLLEQTPRWRVRINHQYLFPWFTLYFGRNVPMVPNYDMFAQVRFLLFQRSYDAGAPNGRELGHVVQLTLFQLLIVVLQRNSAEFGVTVAAIPIVLILLILCGLAVQREVKTWGIFLLVCLLSTIRSFLGSWPSHLWWCWLLLAIVWSILVCLNWPRWHTCSDI